MSLRKYSNECLTAGHSGRYIRTLRALHPVRMSWLTAPQWSRQHRLYAWLVDITRRQGDDILGRAGDFTSYMHAWRLNRSCPDPRYGCNCDINDYVWRENRELRTNKAKLSVIQLRFGDTGEAGDDERGYHTLETEVLWHKLRVLQVTLRQVLMKLTECIKAKNQTSFKSVKKLKSVVLKYKIPY